MIQQFAWGASFHIIVYNQFLAPRYISRNVTSVTDNFTRKHTLAKRQPDKGGTQHHTVWEIVKLLGPWRAPTNICGRVGPPWPSNSMLTAHHIRPWRGSPIMIIWRPPFLIRFQFRKSLWLATYRHVSLPPTMCGVCGRGAACVENQGDSIQCCCMWDRNRTATSMQAWCQTITYAKINVQFIYFYRSFWVD